MTNGFLLNVGNRDLFYCTDKKNITKPILNAFIDKIGEIRNLSPELIDRCKNDEPTLKDLRYRINKVSLEKRDTGKIQYYNISGKYFTINIPLNESECLIIFN